MHGSALSVAYVLVNYLIPLLHSSHFLTVPVCSSFTLCVCHGKRSLFARKIQYTQEKIGWQA